MINIDFNELARLYIHNVNELRHGNPAAIGEYSKLECLDAALSEIGVSDDQERKNLLALFAVGEMSNQIYPEKVPKAVVVPKKPNRFVRMDGNNTIIVVTEEEYLKPGFIDDIMDCTCGISADGIMIEDRIYDRVKNDVLLMSELSVNLEPERRRNIMAMSIFNINQLKS